MQINGIWNYIKFQIDIFIFICILYIIHHNVKQKTCNKMERSIIIIRSLRVALVLAILCVSFYLTMLKSLWFTLAILASLFFLDSSDSMVVWRIKRIEVYQNFKSLIQIYRTVSIASVCVGGYAFVLGTLSVLESRYMWLAIAYAVFVTIFSIRYIIMVVLTRKDIDTQREIAEEEKKEY